MHRGYLLAFLLIPVVVSQRKPHSAGSVQLLKVNETARPLGSDLEFSWAKCVICDGYEARLYLQDTFGKREVPYQLKSAVTALKVRDVPPRTVYRMVLRRLPSDASGSEVSGRSFSPDAPLPVENLAARVLTNSSIQIEWTARSADGFFVRILGDNALVQERRIPDFSNHTILNITNLKADTNFDVQVTAFYFPPVGKSISSVSSVQVKTLPLVLPTLLLEWGSDFERRLMWTNPESPVPVAHKLTCMNGLETLVSTKFSGTTSFVILPSIDDYADLNCVLETWFSIDLRTVVTSKIRKPAKIRSPSSAWDHLNCRRGGGTISASLGYTLQQVNDVELLVLSLSKTFPNDVDYTEMDYKLCGQDAPCNDSWLTIRGSDSLTLLQKRGILEAWTPYTLFYRCRFRCKNYDNSVYTTIRQLELPSLVGPVDPVIDLVPTNSGVSWKYNASATSPAYFLVTHCAEDNCTSESVPGGDRAVSLGKQKMRSVHYVTVQAVKLRNGRAYVSPTEMTSFLLPQTESSDSLTLTYEEITETSTVRLLIAQNSSADLPPVVEYHVNVCRKPVSIWNDTMFDSLLTADVAVVCEPMDPTNSSLDLDREPWTLYIVSVVACYGDIDSNGPVNMTLPIFKQAPIPVASLWWTRYNATVQWTFESPVLSGFAIVICPSQNGHTPSCNETLIGPLDREYHVESSELVVSGFKVSITPFVAHDGRFFNGTRSELLVDAHATSSQVRP